MDTATYQAQQANIDAAWQAAQAQVQQQRTALGTQYGGSFDSNGNFSVDNNSQFGAVQNLRMNQGLDLTNELSSENARNIGRAGYGLAGQRANLMRYQNRQDQFNLLQQAQSNYMQTASDLQSAKSQHDSDSTNNSIAMAKEAALENAWTPAPTPAVPGSPYAPQAGVGASQSSYLSPFNVAKAANKSTKSVIGKPGNSGIHAM